MKQLKYPMRDEGVKCLMQKIKVGYYLLTTMVSKQSVWKLLVESLNRRGHKVVVFAPSNNQSATGMRINLMTPLSWRFRDDLKLEWDVEDNNLHLIE